MLKNVLMGWSLLACQYLNTDAAEAIKGLQQCRKITSLCIRYGDIKRLESRNHCTEEKKKSKQNYFQIENFISSFIF